MERQPHHVCPSLVLDASSCKQTAMSFFVPVCTADDTSEGGGAVEPVLCKGHGCPDNQQPFSSLCKVRMILGKVSVYMNTR